MTVGDYDQWPTAALHRSLSSQLAARPLVAARRSQHRLLRLEVVEAHSHVGDAFLAQTV